MCFEILSTFSYFKKMTSLTDQEEFEKLLSEIKDGNPIVQQKFNDELHELAKSTLKQIQNSSLDEKFKKKSIKILKNKIRELDKLKMKYSLSFHVIKYNLTILCKELQRNKSVY